MGTPGRRPRRRWIAAAVVLAFFAVASVAMPPPATNASEGPLFVGAQVDAAVIAIFRRSCQDCHSDHTIYPWYSYVAPSPG